MIVLNLAAVDQMVAHKVHTVYSLVTKQPFSLS